MFFPLRLIMHWPSKLILSLCWFWRQNLFGETLENFSKVNGNRYVYNCNSKLKAYFHTNCFLCISTVFNFIKHMVDFFLGNYCPEISVLVPRYRWFSANTTLNIALNISLFHFTDVADGVKYRFYSWSSRRRMIPQFNWTAKFEVVAVWARFFGSQSSYLGSEQNLTSSAVMNRPIFNVVLARTKLK